MVSAKHSCSVVCPGTFSSKRNLNHYFDVLKPLPAFFNRSYWCYACLMRHDQETDQRCDAIYSFCLRFDCERDLHSLIKCDDCSLTFHGQTCFVHHKLLTKAGAKVSRRTICSTVISVRSVLYGLYGPIEGGKDASVWQSFLPAL